LTASADHDPFDGEKVEPYALASRGLAQIGLGSLEAGFASLKEAFEETTSVKSPRLNPLEERRPATFDLYQLRGMAFLYIAKYREALDDMERALATRVSGDFCRVAWHDALVKPSDVKETGEFRFSLACIRANLGEVVQAEVRPSRPVECC
jgi:hypothetical protein